MSERYKKREQEHMSTILQTEGAIAFRASTGKVTSSMSVFYNPVMKLNRDISIAIARSLGVKTYTDLLAGSGIRSLRLLKEGGVERVYANDYSTNAVRSMKENAKRNKLTKRITISCENANSYFEHSKGSDVIDIDPFGSPNPYLDGACRRIGRKGILAVTATDTAPLAGTYPSTCKRNYWAVPLRNHLKHEIALRILIRKIQLCGAQYDKALTPLYCHSSNHYYRVYLQCEKGGRRADEIIHQHNMLEYDKKIMTLRRGTTIGPLWTGRLWSENLANILAEKVPNSLTRTIAEEATINTIGYFDLHELSSRLKRPCPNFETLMTAIKKQGHSATRVHTNPAGIKTTMTYQEFLKEVKKA